MQVQGLGEHILGGNLCFLCDHDLDCMSTKSELNRDSKVMKMVSRVRNSLVGRSRKIMGGEK